MTKRVQYAIEEIGRVIGGATPPTRDESNYGGDIPWITPKDLSSFNGRYIKRGERNITEKGLKSCSAQLMPPNTVLFSSRAPIGYVAIAANELCTNQGFKSIVANEDKINFLFLYYYLVYKKQELEGLGSGTTFKEISGSVLKKHKIEIPESLLEQREIATTLSCLDDMIELNDLMNKNLEEMAHAIFKNWFVDFEFPDKNGNPYKSSGGEMIESELGEIPRGWEIRNFTDMVEICGGGTPKTEISEYWNGDIPFFTPKDINSNYYVLNTEKYITQDGLKKCNSKFYSENTVFITARGTIGKIALSARPMAMNQSCYALIGRNDYLCTFFIHQLAINTVNKLKHKANGAVFDAIVTRDFDNEKIIVPPISCNNNYEKHIQHLYKFMQKNIIENNILTQIRDVLLPKLMSGEINVPLKEAM